MLSLILVIGSGLGLCSASWTPPMGNGIAPFAPANDDAWLNYMFWQSLAGKPVESQASLVDAYDEAADSFNQWLLTGGPNGGMAVSPSEYQMYTQPSNPASAYLGYDLFSPGQDGGNMGDAILEPNSPFWHLQYLNGINRVAGAPIDNHMLRQFAMWLNSMPSYQYPATRPVAPWANFQAWENAQAAFPTAPAPAPASRKRRSAGGKNKKRKRRSANRKRRSASKQ